MLYNMLITYYGKTSRRPAVFFLVSSLRLGNGRAAGGPALQPSVSFSPPASASGRLGCAI